MRCSVCGSEAPETAKFCETCGSPLQTREAAAQAGGKQASSAPFVLSIIALVAAVLGLFPVSIILAIIALAMNSGQKKRGEASTKQTPTFVMGLISLILSILMAIFTALIGGAVWLYLADHDFDLDKISNTSGSEGITVNINTEDGTVSIRSFDTDEHPTLQDFTWFTGDMVEGNLPQNAVKLTSLSEVEGDWKAYSFGSGMEHFFNVEIDDEGSNVTVEFDWYYTHDGTTDEDAADDTPDSTFTGTWNAGLDATGPGRVTLTDFWQLDDRQYATGSFVWPSGEVDTMLMVRP